MQITTHGGTTDASDKSQAQVPFAAAAGSASFDAWNTAINACLLVVQSDSYCVPNPPTLKQYRELIAAQMHGLKK